MPRLRTPQGHTLPLPRQRVSLGESAGNDIPITEGHGVAARHFYLQPWESGYFLEDAASGLGTMVNGHPVTWAPLKHGDIITAGSLTLLYEHEDGIPLPDFATPGAADSGVEPSRPPAWLPEEALLPPLSPAAQAALAANAAGKRKERRLVLPVALLVIAAAAAAGWWFFLRR